MSDIMALVGHEAGLNRWEKIDIKASRGGVKDHEPYYNYMTEFNDPGHTTGSANIHSNVGC